ncbi:filamentous hemagglutinin N-terminal domain-containing protein [Candidatus Venteria ishoeyi]|uniref:two-partner secretion domain-containing protein n=1 Tax=Candidatus Venteria ishoeyi TaxID=1899563 RepID=UPI0025A63DC5|nr:filamentous hemagglutinin N-terminal domain-containing protein [Candidatus Venteria ishoeyi]MDM8547215.1 filamentous hemagglutinin N-terminal domain-containing protein [Candidatus Venteria ishoeyi]
MMRHYEKNKIQKSLETLQSQTLVPFVSFVSLVLFFPVQAEISLSSIGNEQLSINDGEYAITQDLGVTAGNNLFHSFHSFNINQGETAAFSGAAHIENVISRVTGGSPSNINGMIRNSIPGADTYLMNPAGIMFGEHAQLDVQGGFHATTANNLTFTDGTEFHVDIAQPSKFSSTTPQAFGFLGNATISANNTKLAVPAGETLALAAGNIHIHGDTAIEMNNTVTEPIDATSWLAASGGEIHLRTPDDGVIELERSLIDSSGAGGGLLDLSGGRLDMRESYLNATLWTAGREGLTSGVRMDFKESIFIRSLDFFRTVSLNSYGGDYLGSLIIQTPFLHMDESIFATTQLSHGVTANYDIHADHFLLENGAQLSMNAFKTGTYGNDLRIYADTLELRGRLRGERITLGMVLREYPSGISTPAFGGQGGNLYIEAKHINMDNGGYFAVSSLGSGDGGNLRVSADDLQMRHGSYMSSVAHGSGKAGTIDVQVNNNLLMEKRSITPFYVPFAMNDPDPPEAYKTGYTSIISFAYPESQGGGQIKINAGTLDMHTNAFIKATSYANTAPEQQGHINVTADTITLRGGAQIKNDNFQETARIMVGAGDSGNLDITAKQIDIAGSSDVHANSAFSTDSYGVGKGGNINVTAEEIVLHDGGAIISRNIGDGDAGRINISSNNIKLNNGGKISSEALNAGGGQIKIQADGILHAEHSQITTSVQKGTGNGGNLNIDAAFLVQDQAPIIARAVEGSGGNIAIETKGVFKFPPQNTSPIDASSQFGISGQVALDTPEENTSSGLFIVKGQFLRDEKLSLEQCEKITSLEQLNRYKEDVNPQGQRLNSEWYQ